MDTIQFPYRSARHLGLLHVIGESGSWEKHDLRVEYDYWISAEDAHKGIAEGSVEFVGGNHLTPYSARARGDNWVYVGQTQNVMPHKLVVREDSGIDSVDDLRGKVVGGLPATAHPQLTTWLYLKQHGLDGEQGEVTLKESHSQPQAVKDGEVDAVFVTAPADLRARNMGLKVIDVDFMPMIEFTTLSTSLTFVDRHPDLVERFVKGVMEGIAFFKTRKAETLDIMRAKYSPRGEELDEAACEHLYEELASTLESKLYPGLRAVDNVYTLAVHEDEAAAQVEPMSLWDTHFARRLDDSGFIDSLYAPARG